MAVATVQFAQDHEGDEDEDEQDDGYCDSDLVWRRLRVVRNLRGLHCVHS